MSDPTIESSQPVQTDGDDSDAERVGTPWWRRALGDANKPTSRREALGALLVTGGALAGLAVALGGCAPWIPPAEAPSPNDEEDEGTHLEAHAALTLQRTYGWGFGAETESFAWDGETLVPFDRAALAHAPSDLRPARVDLAPYYVPTLFQSPMAVPAVSPPPTNPAFVTSLADAIHPIISPRMQFAFRRGRSLAGLLAEVPDVALVIDLPGPEAVAFAAGALGGFDPVFTFDNWPHPHFVVPSHLTLAAALYYQPLFAKAGAAGDRRRPAFVLDRRRLDAYSEAAGDFDNRYVARLPSVPALSGLGVQRVLYVAPDETVTHEMDDLNDDFVAYTEGGIDVSLIAASSFAPEPSGPTDGDGVPIYYGGTVMAQAQFWSDYPWLAPGVRMQMPREPRRSGRGAYVPATRITVFSSGMHKDDDRPHHVPAGFGAVPVHVRTATGTVIAPAAQRSGSWTRASGTGGG